ncbi:MAG: hypothetical protein QOF58_5100 [Pseudonocardiales bacterium]|jgi:hypothetical protein|nr:hypothetical protein [Pseudonocardiales bacterium]
MPATHLLYRHDDGRWLRARIVQQVRSGPNQRWRVLVTYTTAPGFTFTRGEWADSPRLAPVGTHEPYRPTVADMAREAERAQRAG